jgi:cytoskeletal protein RodZ
MDNEIKIGELLKEKRESFSLTIKEISRYLKVKEGDIILLEQDMLNSIINTIYLPGLIRQYAKIVKIEDDIVKQCIKNISAKYNINSSQCESANASIYINKCPSKSDLLYAILVFAIMSLALIFFSPLETNNLEITDMIVNQFKQNSDD